MTPKRKGKSMIDGFLPEIHKFAGGQESHSKEFARRLAIITVDEIIKSGPSSDTLPDVTSIHYDELKEAIRYWEEVKKELQKL